ncbi:MAG TPA: isoprenylcysteine carboxylmethyltransferase family protein [Desulfovibrio sp.]|jgi:protein-S-isoprenylcysteine O-methyltransferase Ste14|nr:isoprenylcysteine carboxylmethyltransferase family protein [Desulfovibrio sp.]
MSSDAGLLHGPFWGVSARVLLPALLVEAAGAVCTVWAPDLFSLGLLPRYVWFVLGCLLFVAGGVCIRQARHEVRRSIRDGTFPSEGLYRYTRNPMEAGWIFGILPGGALLAGSWLMLAGPVTAWAVFRDAVVADEAIMLARYGEAWRRYTVRVGRLVPDPGRRARD